MELAEKLQFPILADPLSQLRSGDHSGDMIIDTYGTFLRNEEAKKNLQPDIIIRFGAMPVSKVLTLFLKENFATKTNRCRWWSGLARSSHVIIRNGVL